MRSRVFTTVCGRDNIRAIELIGLCQSEVCANEREILCGRRGGCHLPPGHAKSGSASSYFYGVTVTVGCSSQSIAIRVELSSLSDLGDLVRISIFTLETPTEWIPIQERELQRRMCGDSSDAQENDPEQRLVDDPEHLRRRAQVEIERQEEYVAGSRTVRKRSRVDLPLVLESDFLLADRKHLVAVPVRDVRHDEKDLHGDHERVPEDLIRALLLPEHERVPEDIQDDQHERPDAQRRHVRLDFALWTVRLRPDHSVRKDEQIREQLGDRHHDHRHVASIQCVRQEPHVALSNEILHALWVPQSKRRDHESCGDLQRAEHVEKQQRDVIHQLQSVQLTVGEEVDRRCVRDDQVPIRVCCESSIVADTILADAVLEAHDADVIDRQVPFVAVQHPQAGRTEASERALKVVGRAIAKDRRSGPTRSRVLKALDVRHLVKRRALADHLQERDPLHLFLSPRSSHPAVRNVRRLHAVAVLEAMDDARIADVRLAVQLQQLAAPPGDQVCANRAGEYQARDDCLAETWSAGSAVLRQQDAKHGLITAQHRHPLALFEERALAVWSQEFVAWFCQVHDELQRRWLQRVEARVALELEGVIGPQPVDLEYDVADIEGDEKEHDEQVYDQLQLVLGVWRDALLHGWKEGDDSQRHRPTDRPTD